MTSHGEEALAEAPGDDGDREDADGRLDDATPELFEVLPDGHLAFGRRGGGRAARRLVGGGGHGSTSVPCAASRAPSRARSPASPRLARRGGRRRGATGAGPPRRRSTVSGRAPYESAPPVGYSRARSGCTSVAAATTGRGRDVGRLRRRAGRIGGLRLRVGARGHVLQAGAVGRRAHRGDDAAKFAAREGRQAPDLGDVGGRCLRCGGPRRSRSSRACRRRAAGADRRTAPPCAGTEAAPWVRGRPRRPAAGPRVRRS